MSGVAAAVNRAMVLASLQSAVSAPRRLNALDIQAKREAPHEGPNVVPDLLCPNLNNLKNDDLTSCSCVLPHKDL